MLLIISLESILFIVIICLLALILALICVSLFAYKLSAKYVSKNTITKKEHYDLLNKKACQHETVFLGDSLTEFYDIDEFFHQTNAYNRGIAGDTTDGVLNRLQSNVISLQPSTVLLQIGTNDLGYKKDPKYVYENIIKIIKWLQNDVPNINIYVISLYPVNDKAYKYSNFLVKPRKNEDIILINNLLKEYCSQNHLEFIDIFPHLLDEHNRLKKEYTIEGLHINFEGYIKITEIISSVTKLK